MTMKIAVKRGDIVEVDLRGALGSEKQNDPGSGHRPCIVVQNDKGNGVSDLTIIVPLNDLSQAKGLRVQVVVTAAELGPGGKDSVVECGHVRSIDGDARVKKYLGTLAPNAMRRVDKALRVSLNL